MNEKHTKRQTRIQFSFSLRTLFALVFFAAVTTAWTLRTLNWIRQRRDALQTEGISGNPDVRSIYDPPQAPGGLWIFGEVGHPTLIVSGNRISKERTKELRELFPEAKVFVFGGRWQRIAEKK